MPAAVTAKPVIVWFRDDLRLADHPALHAAVATHAPLLCIYIFDKNGDGSRPLGAASRWWLHHSLESLGRSIAERGGRLDVFAGAAEPVLTAILEGVEPGALYMNRRYQQAEMQIDEAVAAMADEHDVAVHDFQAQLLNEPSDVKPQSGDYYKVFTPYLKAATAREHIASPVSAPSKLRDGPALTKVEGFCEIADLKLLPKIAWDAGFTKQWEPGEAAAQKALHAFVRGALDDYPEARNTPGIEGSSRLSPRLRFGEVSPAQVYAAVEHHKGSSEAKGKFLAELHWRDFTHMLLHVIPDIATHPVQKLYEAFPYRKLPKHEWDAWTKGQTGYPIVDAGMRQLWQTGFMHNRVRMITASFLIKHLLSDWRAGEQWFWDTLCDADPGNNPINWQWVAGCGIDPVPYFRIFNPVLQGEKFDDDGAYVRRYVPEIAALPDKWLQHPWDAPKAVLDEAEIKLGDTYPKPIVDHAKARARALAALRTLREERD